MSINRVLGVVDLDAAGGLVARRCLDSGAALVILDRAREQASTIGRGGDTITFAAELGALTAALPRPRAVLVDLGAIELGRREAALAETLAGLEPGDLMLTCSCGSCGESVIIDSRCASAGLRYVDLGVSGSTTRPANSVVAAGGTSEDWGRVSDLMGDASPSALLGACGSGTAFALVNAALRGLDIQLIAEAYHILKAGIRMSHDEMRTVFAQWNSGELADPLIAATADALGLRDEDGDPLLEKVLDAVAPEHISSRAALLALDVGAPVTMMAQAASAAAIAALKDERVDASAVLGGPKPAQTGERHPMVVELGRGLRAAMILALDESLSLLRRSSAAHDLDLDLIRATGLLAGSGRIKIAELAAAALGRSGGRSSILLDASFKSELDQCLPSLRRVVVRAIEGGIPVPTFSAALSFYDGYRSTWLPANLTNALKDSFLGLGFERIDRPRGEKFHSDWK